MPKCTVELEWDAVDSIVVQALKNRYSSLKKDLERNFQFQFFFVDDVAEIQKHLDSIKTILSYSMNHEEFEEWSNA